MSKEHVDLIISINVHEKPFFLIDKQLKNIHEHVLVSKKIILNCNKFMYDILTDLHLKDVIINPEHIEKRTYHGSICRGIYSNLNFALQNYNFKYFAVTSSREMFLKTVSTVNQIKELSIYNGGFDGVYGTAKSREYDISHQWWKDIVQTSFFNYLKINNMFFSNSPHEGMCFDYLTCCGIKGFVDSNKELMAETFNLGIPVEEFMLQSLSVNFNGFSYIGNGVSNSSPDTASPISLTYKVNRSEIS